MPRVIRPSDLPLAYTPKREKRWSGRRVEDGWNEGDKEEIKREEEQQENRGEERRGGKEGRKCNVGTYTCVHIY